MFQRGEIFLRYKIGVLGFKDIVLISLNDNRGTVGFLGTMYDIIKLFQYIPVSSFNSFIANKSNKYIISGTGKSRDSNVPEINIYGNKYVQFLYVLGNPMKFSPFDYNKTISTL